MVDLLDSAGATYVAKLAPALRDAARLWNRASDRPDIRADLISIMTNLLGKEGARAWVDKANEIVEKVER